MVILGGWVFLVSEVPQYWAQVSNTLFADATRCRAHYIGVSDTHYRVLKPPKYTLSSVSHTSDFGLGLPPLRSLVFFGPNPPQKSLSGVSHPL